MARMHIGVGVTDLDQAVAFYSTLFGHAPTMKKDDYAQWILDDPSVNFSVSNRGGQQGVSHLGIQAESEEEYAAVTQRLGEAEGKVRQEGETTCCYARSTKEWIVDPTGTPWETFLTHDRIEDFGTSNIGDLETLKAAAQEKGGKCC